MIINAANIATLRQGLQTRFTAGLQSAPSVDVERIATVVPSTTAIENYPFMAFLDTIREWIGPRQLGNLLTQNMQVTNGNYEATIAVPANAIEDDQVGIYGSIAEGKGRQCRALWIKIAIDAMVANGTWLDGSAFFGTTRTFGGNTIANYVTTALSSSTYGTARQTMMSYLGYDDQPLEIVPDTLIVGPALEATAKKIVENDKIVESYAGDTDDATILNHVAGPNPYYGTAELIVHPRLVGTYANYWFLADTKQVIKPVLVQKRKEGPLVALDKPTDANVFFGGVPGSEDVVEGGLYVYGTHYRGAAALTLPHLLYGGYKS